MLALHEFAPTSSDLWLPRASRLAKEAVKRFTQTDGRPIPSMNQASLPMKLPDLGDNDYASGTSSLIELLLRLRHCADSKPDMAWLNAAANKTIKGVAGVLMTSPGAWPSMVTAVSAYMPVAEVADAKQHLRAASSVLQSSDKVQLSSIPSSNNDERPFILHLSIEPGFHINANPASMDFLIPTSIHVDGAPDLNVRYPKPESFSPRFVDETIHVWSGELRLTARFKPQDEARPGYVRVQACNDRICLPPSNLPFTVKGRHIQVQ